MENLETSWMTKDETSLWFREYSVASTKVMVGCRPDFRGVTKDFFHSVSAWMSLTDRLVAFPTQAVVQWSCWDERYPISHETLFSALRTLQHWICHQKREAIYIFCDAGTHRSPTVFGLFLRTFFPDQAQEICDNGKLFRGEHFSCPMSYSAHHLKDRRATDAELLSWLGADTINSPLFYQPEVTRLTDRIAD